MNCVFTDNIAFKLHTVGGRVDPATKTMSLGAVNTWDSGLNPAIALNNRTIAVEVHQGDGNPERIYYSVGSIDPTTKWVSFCARPCRVRRGARLIRERDEPTACRNRVSNYAARNTERRLPVNDKRVRSSLVSHIRPIHAKHIPRSFVFLLAFLFTAGHHEQQIDHLCHG
jgi:hypothetical protein